MRIELSKKRQYSIIRVQDTIVTNCSITAPSEFHIQRKSQSLEDPIEDQNQAKVPILFN